MNSGARLGYAMPASYKTSAVLLICFFALGCHICDNGRIKWTIIQCEISASHITWPLSLTTQCVKRCVKMREHCKKKENPANLSKMLNLQSLQAINYI